jgi:propanol-preferring alcohol dehydrogenase
MKTGLTFIGSSVGTEDQLKEAAAGIISPAIEVFDFSSVPTLIDRLREDGITGRAVVKLPQ